MSNTSGATAYALDRMKTHYGEHHIRVLGHLLAVIFTMGTWLLFFVGLFVVKYLQYDPDEAEADTE